MHGISLSLTSARGSKCDERVPECSQCQKYGRTCPGYRRTFRFQDEGPSLARRHRSTTRRRRRAVSTGSTTPSTATPATPVPIEPFNSISPNEENAGATNVVRDNAIALMRRHSTVSLDENVSPSLVRTSFKSAQPQLFLDFISASFPTLYFHNRFRAGNDPGFAENIIMNFGKDTYLDSAICSLSSVYLAHLTQDATLLRTSRRLYGICLGEVIRALSKPAHALSDNMLCTAMMLSVYEMYAQTSTDAWAVHSDAVKQLMISRGPAAHKTGFGRSCWIAFRGFHIATAIYRSQPCFLDQPEWQEYTYQTMSEDARKPGEWSAYAVISDRAFAEIAKCPRYITEARDILSSRINPDQRRVTTLIARIKETSRQLRALSCELRACIGAHSQRQQGIIRRPGTFVGPVPEIFPETGPSLLLRGAENIQETLRQLCARLEDRTRFRVLEDKSPTETVVEMPASDGSPASSSSSLERTSSRSFSLPFRIHSELGRGPSRTSDRKDARAVIWLDRVASSMGVLGTKVIVDDRIRNRAPVKPDKHVPAGPGILTSAIMPLE